MEHLYIHIIFGACILGWMFFLIFLDVRNSGKVNLEDFSFCMGYGSIVIALVVYLWKVSLPLIGIGLAFVGLYHLFIKLSKALILASGSRKE